jgi:hypothetical protein
MQSAWGDYTRKRAEDKGTLSMDGPLGEFCSYAVTTIRHQR